MKTLIIAEKPSVATDLSRVLGKFKKVNDHYENDDIIISSAVGHLVELFMPHDIDPKLKSWRMAALPIIPKKFDLKPIERTEKKFKDLKKLINRKDVGTIVNACDAGREGELIFTYIYELCKSKKPTARMWMQSMTPDSIKLAYEEMRKSEEMTPLREAARCRSESDWLIGINGTRAVTNRMLGHARKGHAATVGRVQTPTLSLVCEREIEIKNFKPRPYWRIRADFGVVKGEYEGMYQKANFKKGDDEHDRVDRIWEKEVAEAIIAEVRELKEATVTEEKKRSTQQSPRLYDLTSLQREANSRFGMPAGMTLKITQSLYEKHKMVTYPRTDSRALPENYGPTCEAALNSLAGDYATLAKKVIKNDWINLKNKRIFNDKQVRDHFAIIPTDQKPKKLSEDEQKIYDMIARRFIAVFYPAAEYDVTTRISKVENHNFKTEGKVLAVPGWLEVYGKNEMDKESLVPLTEKDGKPTKAKVNKAYLDEETTKPPPRYTEATLLAAMESAGKLLDDEDLAEAMKERGLGTPATRAQTIDHLIRERYLLRQARELMPTAKAEQLMEFLKAVDIELLTSPQMTGEWEYKLNQIEENKLTRKEFMQGIEEVTQTIVDRTKDYQETKASKKKLSFNSFTDKRPMVETIRTYQSQDGELVIYKVIGQRKLMPEEVQILLEKRVIGPLDGFYSKAGKPFSAMLKLDDDNKVKFVFDQQGQDKNGEEEGDISQFPVIANSPLDGSPIHETPTAYVSESYLDEKTRKESGLRVSRNLLGRTIEKEQFLKLINDGKTDLLDKFRSKRTNRYFSAHLILKPDGSIGFEFQKKAPKSKKS